MRSSIPFRSLVSIIMPSYNSKVFIRQTIESVKKQTYENWELIIVDDASTDNSKDMIKEYLMDDSRIKLITLQENVGPGEARNMAIQAAKGHYIAFLNSKDLWAPNKLEKQLEFMEAHNLAFSYTDYQFIDEENQAYEPVIEMPVHLTYQDLLRDTTAIGCSTVMIDKYKVGKIQLVHNRDIPEDFALWLSILKRGFKAKRLKNVYVYLRKSNDVLEKNNYQTASRIWSLYRQVEKLGVFESAFCFVNYAKHEAKRNRSLKE
ncbi:glycosyltransferase family 2 protein [Bacillus sp. E214]|uniref:glycosyltransferase family 2 protein n=1 Tax=Bacillus sp. E214 TaxID=2587156 RepID=UPI0011E02C04|nr:glycosyltransferase family 2 protein [Bacillus sp. E214]